MSKYIEINSCSKCPYYRSMTDRATPDDCFSMVCVHPDQDNRSTRDRKLKNRQSVLHDCPLPNTPEKEVPYDGAD